MKKRISWSLIGVFLVASLFIGYVWAAAPVSEVYKWVLLNPEGVREVKPLKLAPRIDSLEGKTVMLYTNGKLNSDNFLERVAELLTKQVKDIRIIKSWKVAPETNRISQHENVSKETAVQLAKFKPDLVIGSQAD